MPASRRPAASKPACVSAKSAWAASAAWPCAPALLEGWPTWLEVSSAQPVLACLGSQYAGWSLAASKEETGGKKFFSLGSGPARALAAKEKLFAELGYRDRAEQGVLVLEVDRPPPKVIIDKLLKDCALTAEGLTLILTPTTSLAGTTQVVARVLEVALHKAHELGFALGNIVDGAAAAPLPAPSPDGVLAMGRTNDAILYGGQVHLTVRGERCRGAAARPATALLQLARLRPFVRRHLQGGRVRLLQDRRRLVRAGRGVGQQPRQRQHLARRRAEHAAAAGACGCRSRDAWPDAWPS